MLSKEFLSSRFRDFDFQRWWLKPWINVLILVALTGTVYFNSLNNDFLSDDKKFVKDNVSIRDLGNIPSFFFSAATLAADHPEWGTQIYRPLRTLSYAIDYHIYGLNKVGYHITSLVLHVLVSITLYYVILNLFNLPLVSLLGALIFAIHPVHVEAVSWISGRADLIGFLFLNLSFLSYIYYRNSDGLTRYLFLSLVCSFLAYMGKETMVPLPGLIILYDYVEQRDKTLRDVIRSNFGNWILFSVVCFLYLYVRFSVTGSMSVGQDWWGGSAYSNFLMMVVATAKYLSLLLFPLSLSYHYIIEPVQTIFNPRLIISAFVVFLSAVLIAFFHKKNKTVFFLLSWFYLSLVPIANIIPISFSMMAERFIYMASAGPIIALSYGLFSLYQKVSKHKLMKMCCYLLLGFMIFAFSLLTYQRNEVWQNNETLWTDSVEKSPNSAVVRNNLGIVYASQGRLDDAIQEYIIALKLVPDFVHAYHNLGFAYAKQGRLDAAIQEYLKSLKLKPDFVESRNNLGVVYVQQNRLDEAIKEYMTALRLKPDFAEAHNNLGNAYALRGQMNEAINEIKIALKLKPNIAAAHNTLGFAYAQQGKLEAAMSAYREALELDPEFAEPHNNIGLIYVHQGRDDEAINEYKKALALKPEYVEAYNNLAILYLDSGRLSDAMSLVKRALSIDQENGDALNTLGEIYLKLGEFDDALKEFEKALETEETASRHWNAAIASERLGIRDRAVEHWKRFIDLSPHSEDVVKVKEHLLELTGERYRSR